MNIISNINNSKEIISNEDDAELKEMAKLELEDLNIKKTKLEDDIKLLLTPKDPNDHKNVIPKSGLNFLKNEKINSRKFLLICGFENFKNFYIRVDILERLFLKIIDNTKEGMFKIDSDMINLIGCNKENFFELLKLMNYRPKKTLKNKEDFFIYQPDLINKKNKKIVNKSRKSSPFGKLSELRFR